MDRTAGLGVAVAGCWASGIDYRVAIGVASIRRQRELVRKGPSHGPPTAQLLATAPLHSRNNAPAGAERRLVGRYVPATGRLVSLAGQQLSVPPVFLPTIIPTQ